MNFDNLEKYMDRLTSWRIPGNAISVYYKNKEVFSYSSGYENVNTKTPMSPEEYLYIYSCSKVTTVVAALQLYEKGYFLLDNPLSEFIPEFKKMYIKNADGSIREAKKEITLRNLFTMTAGFTYNLESESIKKAIADTNGRADTLSVVKSLANEPLSFEPGERWQYSLCHDILAGVVEVISGMRFSDYAKKNIFNPLGIEAYYHVPHGIRMATQYEFKTETSSNDYVASQISSKSGEGVWIENNKNCFIFGDEYDSGGAGIITKVSEYAKLADALANGGFGATGENILSKGTIDLLRANQLNEQQKQYLTWGQLKGCGYGLGVRTMQDIAKAGSTGTTGEFGWCGAAGAALISDAELGVSCFYAHHMLNPQEDYYLPRLRNVLYSCFGK